jgi:lipopolysaccharide/colanic/teichoic acid biosynthesis glycosyltransferase
MSVLSTNQPLVFPATALDEPPVPLAINESASKRVMDVVCSVGGLLALSWLFVAIAVAIKLDSRGPVFYLQRRLGKDGQVFTIFKFRTMVPEADVQGAALRHGKRDSGLLFKNENDPRITRVGRWLRKTSLDELPQLINIFKGEMSVVGPRPLPEEDTRYYEDWQWGRLAVLPGLTGLWQVSGRSLLSADAMVKLDLRYIREWSLMKDIVLIAKTIPAVFNRYGAY